MIVRVHGFDWVAYSERVMPAFAKWLVDNDESAIYELYEQTRCARNEQFVPDAVKHLCTWPRAQAFIKQLPRGQQAQREYQKLCAAELFTLLSDDYMRQYPPRLYQSSEALRAVWGAVVEQFCLPWLHAPEVPNMPQSLQQGNPPTAFALEDELETSNDELISLLQSAGLDELAQQVSEQASTKAPEKVEPPEVLPSSLLNDTDVDDDEVEDDVEDAKERFPGISLGRHPSTLHLRGWLAAISVRAMALFEYLACGRRRMPFGYRPGEPYEATIGYLTPEEVWQVALCVAEAQPPDPEKARADYQDFRDQLSDDWDEFRLIDEILPAYASPFLQAVHSAAEQGLGLICTVG